MPRIYLPLEVNFNEDEKVARLARYTRPGEARACRDLLVAMWLYCKRNTTDGHVPLEEVGKLAYPDTPKVALRDADRLIEVGLAKRTDDGYYLPGYLKRNKSAADLAAEADTRSEENSQKGDFGNHVRWHVKVGKPSPTCRFCVANGSQGSDPSRIANGSPTDRRSESPGDRHGSLKYIDKDRDKDKDKDLTTLGGEGSETLPEDPPRCRIHPNGTTEPCAGCAEARHRTETATADDLAQRRRAAKRRADCPHCDDAGFILDADTGTPVARCNHTADP